MTPEDFARLGSAYDPYLLDPLGGDEELPAPSADAMERWLSLAFSLTAALIFGFIIGRTLP